MKTILAILVVLLLLAGVGVGGYYYLQYQNDQPKHSTVSIKDLTLTTEVANTAEKRAQGLSNRASLGSDEGMLFEFPDKNFHGIWMKDMNFPIDIIWIQDEIVVSVKSDVPTPEDPNDLPIYRPSNPADTVLEVNAGLAEQYGIDIGDVVSISD